MTSVDICDENDTPDAFEFVERMSEDRPDDKPGTAIWNLYAREHEDEATACIPRSEIREALCPDARSPHWAQIDESTNHRLPALSAWQSIPARVNTRHQHGFINPNTGMYATPHLKLKLVQSLYAKEPVVRIGRFGTYVDAKKLDELDHYCLTLDEATELAHTLLLLLDVVNETAGA